MNQPSNTLTEPSTKNSTQQKYILQAKGLVKNFGNVVAMNQCNFDLKNGEVLAVIGDNGAGKSVLIKTLSGAIIPDAGKIFLNGQEMHFKTPIEARLRGIETVYQNLAVAPSLDIADNLYLGRELRKPGILGTVFRMLDRKRMQQEAQKQLKDLGLLTIQNISQTVETLSGGQRQGVAVSRATVFKSKVIIMDEPTAALGVKESALVLQLIKDLRSQGLPVVLISHNMPHVFEVANRIHIHRLGQRVAVVKSSTHTMSDAVSIMTGAMDPNDHPAGAFCE